MTGFEYIYLMNEFEVKLGASIGMQFSIVSAFLVAAYAASDRLSIRMLSIVIGVYTLMVLIVALNIWSTQLDMSLLAEEALAKDASGVIELPRTSMISEWSAETYNTLSRFFIGLEIVIYFASLIFAFGMRRAGLASSAKDKEV